MSRRVGPAVVRSRVRRLVRESFRLHQAEFDKPAAIVVIAKPSMASRQFAQIEADFRAALGQARLLKASS